MRILKPKRLMVNRNIPALLRPSQQSSGIFSNASLDLPFAERKVLTDAISGNNLITFTRTSSGTYVGSDGVLRTATTNLKTYSDAILLGNNVGVVNATLTAVAITTPTGASSASLLTLNVGANTENGSDGFNYGTGSLANSTQHTQSLFAKPAGSTVLRIRSNVTGLVADFTLTGSGTTPSLSADLQAASITPLSSGWYRVSWTYTTTTSIPGNRLDYWAIKTNIADGVNGIYVAGAQLEQSSTVGEYIPTTSTINSAPRFDHNPTTGESLGLLVEEQRTNLHLQSGNLSGYSFTASGAGDALTNFYGTAADGASNKTLRVQTGSLIRTIRWVDNGCGIDAISTQYTVSFFYRGTLPLSVSARVGNTPTLTVIYPPSGSLMGRAQAVITSGTNATAFLDFTYPANSDGELWGIQVEKSVAFPTSYIPTTTATATRSADVASITGTNFSSWYNQSSGTIYADYQWTTLSKNVIATAVGTNANGNNGFLRGYASTTVNPSRVKQAIGLTNFSVGNTVAPANQQSAVNGSLGGLGANIFDGTYPVNVNIGSQPGASSYLNGTVSRVTFWPARLADSTLQAITQ